MSRDARPEAGAGPAPVIDASVPAVRVRDLLWARWRSLRNAPQSQAEGGWLRVGVLVVLGLWVWGGVYMASLWFANKTLALEPFGELMLSKLVGLVLAFFAAVLLFSNIVSAFSSLLLSDELGFLMARAIPPNTLFSARYLESTVSASWMALLFILPVLLAVGHARGAPPGYYLWLPVLIAPIALMAGALATPLVLVLANLFPIYRTREVLVALGIVAFVGFFWLVRVMEPESLLDPERFASTIELFATLEAPTRYWLPSSWASDLLAHNLSGAPNPARSLHLACLFLTPLGGYVLAAWSFRLLHRRAFSRAQQGRGARVARHVQPEQAADQQRRRLERQLARLARGRGVLGPIRAIAHKDALVFTRDAVQWSQLLLLVGIIAIYLLNFRYIGALGAGKGIFGPIGVYFLNIALSSLMVTAVAVRLVFPVVSLEGRAFWLVRRAPISLRRYLIAKWLGHIPPLLILALGLVVASNLLIGTAGWLIAKSALIATLLVIATAGLGVGLGALFPRFHIDDAAKIATGLGGVLFMFVSLSLALVVVALDAYPTYHTLRLELHAHATPPDLFWLKATGAWAAVLLVCVGAATLAIALGARRLRRL